MADLNSKQHPIFLVELTFSNNVNFYLREIHVFVEMRQMKEIE